MLATSISILLLSSVVSAQGACGNDIDCLSKLSQYVVVGTVLSNTKNDPNSSPTNYTASINVKCAFLSFSSTGPDRGDNLIGNSITVSKFGGSNKCPPGFSDATVGSTQIFFIAVETLRPANGARINYQVVDICIGGLETSSSNLQSIGKLMSEYSDKVIPLENRGNDPICASVPTNTNSTQSTPTSRNEPDSASSIAITFALHMLVLLFVLQ